MAAVDSAGCIVRRWWARGYGAEATLDRRIGFGCNRGWWTCVKSLDVKGLRHCRTLFSNLGGLEFDISFRRGCRMGCRQPSNSRAQRYRIQAYRIAGEHSSRVCGPHRIAEQTNSSDAFSRKKRATAYLLAVLEPTQNGISSRNRYDTACKQAVALNPSSNPPNRATRDRIVLSAKSSVPPANRVGHGANESVLSEFIGDYGGGDPNQDISNEGGRAGPDLAEKAVYSN